MKRVLSLVFSAALALGLSPVAVPQVPVAWAADASAPTIDGDLDEWANTAKQASTDPSIDYWQVAKDTKGNVYLAFTGTASTQWVGDYQWKYLEIHGGSNNGYQVNDLSDKAYDNTANGNTPGPYYVEAVIPASSFGGKSDYTIKFAGTTIKASDIPTFKAAEKTDEPATYDGIKIDGKFDDWAAVKKFDTEDPNPEHKQNLAAEAMVFDGDNVYIYIEEGKGGSAAGAGTHSNGQFAITTDLGTGNTLMIQLNRDGSATAGGRTVDCKHVGRQWEIAVPKSMLPAYEKTINFGLYLEDPTITDVANLDGSHGKGAGSFSGITYDGDYSDWADYPHTEIQYATSGTQEHVADASAALYASGNKVYSHVKTTMPAHLQEKGGEFLSAVTYRFNQEKSSVKFYPRFVTVDSQGNINWNPPLSNLQNDTYEYCIVDSQGWATASTLDELESHGNRLYGKMRVTVGDGKDECESELYLDAFAKKLNCSATDFKTIDGRWGRIGQQWVTCAGTPTGPWLGTAIAIGSVVVVVGGYALYRRRKQGAAVNATPASEPAPAR